MKNSITCPHCKSDNAFYNVTCNKCGYYLRDKIYNIDLWSIIIKLIDNPSKAFRNIIYAEHKNFIFFILLFISAKVLINSRFLSMVSVGEFQTTLELFFSYLIVLVSVLIFFIVFTFAYKALCIFQSVHFRFADIISLIIYSQIPFVFGLIILFPLELVIFGDYLFSINPSPFLIKGSIAYLFLVMELALILWNIFLTFLAFKVHSHNLILSTVVTISFVVLFWVLIYFCSVIIFTI